MIFTRKLNLIPEMHTDSQFIVVVVLVCDVVVSSITERIWDYHICEWCAEPTREYKR
jgi:hypothetical protein